MKTDFEKMKKNYANPRTQTIRSMQVAKKEKNVSRGAYPPINPKSGSLR